MLTKKPFAAWRIAITLSLCFLTVILLWTCQGDKNPLKNDYYFYNGDVYTIDKDSTIANALWIKDGIIRAVGAPHAIEPLLTEQTIKIDLKGGAVLPGFVDPHLHVVDQIVLEQFADMSPCLPDRYEAQLDRPHCSVTIIDALKQLGENPVMVGNWIVGHGIDPSRMTLDSTILGSEFRKNPAKYIDSLVSKDTAVYIIDASGHLAYVNTQAFREASVCITKDSCVTICPPTGPCNTRTARPTSQPPSPGIWDTTSIGNYTGLLEETAGMAAFLNAIQAGSTKNLLPNLIKLVGESESVINEYARAGLTTVVNGGALSAAELDFCKVLSESFCDPHPKMRYRSIIQWHLADVEKYEKTPVWDTTNHGLFGYYGIKLWGDGSTQGCTADLKQPYANCSECICNGKGYGHQDYSDTAEINDLLHFWKDDWYIQVHTNGDSAIQNALNTFEYMWNQYPNPHPHTFLHYTVGGNPAKGENMIQKTAELMEKCKNDTSQLDLHGSHLIAHVPYWGGAFQNMLDTVLTGEQSLAKDAAKGGYQGRAALIDGTGSDVKYGVSFSYHSDEPVSPARPLWYIEQGVTRNTWFYPNLAEKDIYPMPGNNKVTINQALRAVTIEPARIHLLDSYIGSLEEGKYADLVVLDKTFQGINPDSIHTIKVLETYVNGNRHVWEE